MEAERSPWEDPKAGDEVMHPELGLRRVTHVSDTHVHTASVARDWWDEWDSDPGVSSEYNDRRYSLWQWRSLGKSTRVGTVGEFKW